MGDFKHPHICWENYTARHKQTRRFLQCIGDNLLTQVVEKPTKRGVMLDFILTNVEGLVGDVRVGDSLGCSDHDVDSGSFKEEAGQKVGLQPWASGKQILASSVIYLEESHGLGP